MGQKVHVRTVRRVSDTVIRYEIDRSLTGMAHETYLSIDHVPVDSPRPPDVLATHLFASGLIAEVHVFSNIITVTLATPSATVHSEEEDSVETALNLIVEDLFIHYHPGVEPTAVTDGVEA